MRRSDISGEALPSSERKAETATGARITKTTALMALALLAQCGHDTKPADERVRPSRVSGVDHSIVPKEILETKRRELSACVKACAGKCTASEAIALSNACGEKPLTPEKLSEAAALLSPELRKSVHSIAVLLGEYPTLAPDVLTYLHEFISELPMTDPRKLAGMIIPTEDPSLEDAGNIRGTSQEFLKLEERSGVYTPRITGTLTADSGVKGILTSISESVEDTR